MTRNSRVEARSRFDAAIADGGTPLGLFLTSVDAAVTAIAGDVGFDFVIIDAEHGMFTIHDVLAHVREAQRVGVVPLVRLLEGTPGLIQQALDAGAAGIVIPKASDPEEIARLLPATQYRPGGRGYCPSVPAADWSRADWGSFAEHANRNTLLIPLIETADGVRNAGAIAGVDGVDFVFFGVADLSQDMGLDLDGDRDQMVQAWNSVRDAVHAAGKRAGAPLNFGLEGPDFGTATGDLGTLRRGLTQQIASLRGDAGRQVG